MSAGTFLDAFYTSDTGDVHNIRIQPESAALVIDGVTNTIPAGPATSDLPVKVSGGRRQVGLTARLIRIRITAAGSSDLTVGSVIALPWLNPETFLTVTRPGKQAGVYRGGATCVVVGGTGEAYRV